MVKVNKEMCIGCGACAASCPASFEMKDGKAAVVGKGNAPCTKDAMAECPVGAISI
jgi:ferredoxin